jgi:hypothetical protein
MASCIHEIISENSYPKTIYPHAKQKCPAQNQVINPQPYTSAHFMKGPTVILSGSIIQPKPRPPTMQPPQIQIDMPVSEPDDPSYLSELLKGGTPNLDPYVSFYDDIQGWEEDTRDDLVVRLLDNKSNASLKYLDCNCLPSEFDGNRRKHLRRRRTKSNKSRPSTSKPKSDSSRARTGTGAEEDANDVETTGIDNELEEDVVVVSEPDGKDNFCDSPELTEAIVEMNLISIEPYHPSAGGRPRLARNTASARSMSQDHLQQPGPPNLDYITVSATDRVALLRKRLISSANNARPSWVGGVNQPPDLEMAILTGKKYQSRGSFKEELSYRSRPQTAMPSAERERTAQVTFAEERMVLPVISQQQAADIPLLPIVSKFTKSLKEPLHRSWIKAPSGRRLNLRGHQSAK